MLQLLNIGVNELREQIECRSVIIVAAGIQGRRWTSIIESWGCGKNILCLMDNDKEKQNKDVLGIEKKYQIVCFESAVQQADRDTLWFITSMYTDSLVAQLSGYSATVEWPVQYTATNIISANQLDISEYETIVKEYDKKVIPATINYAWFGKEKPDFVKRNIDNWHKMCPDFEIKEWNEKNYDISQNEYMRQAYDAKVWGFVPDYLRLDIIYKYGGIYLDTDIEVVRNLEPLLYQNAFACIDASMVVNLGSGFGAKPGHRYIKQLRDYYNKVSFVDKNGFPDKTPCNTHNFNVFVKDGFVAGDFFQTIQGVNIYPMVFQGMAWLTHKSRITEKTYWVHYGNVSWLKH